MIKTGLHLDYMLPGGIHQPAIIDIIERKISLIHKLHELKFVVNTSLALNLTEMIAIEVCAIEEMIAVDKV
jgi:hypothetical protein